MMALITSFIVGCAGFQSDVRTFDTLPDNIPKGYVEFYSDESEDVVELSKNIGGGTWSVYQYEDGIRKEIEGMVWDWRTKRRIAVRPGRHTFMVGFGSADPKVTVEVNKDMLLPVRVIIDLGGKRYRYQETTYYFDMELRVEDAIPFGKQ